MIHLLACAEIDVSKGVHELGKASRRYVKPRVPQETAEDQQVVGETGGWERHGLLGRGVGGRGSKRYRAVNTRSERS